MGYYDWNGQMLSRASVADEYNYLINLKQQFELNLHSLQEALPFAEFSYKDRKSECEPEKIYSDVVNIQKVAIKYFEELIGLIDDAVVSGQYLPGFVSFTKRLLAIYEYPSEYFEPMKDMIRSYFINNGYIVSMHEITDKGESIGLQIIDRVTNDGRAFTQLVFSEQATHLILPYIPQFKQDIDKKGIPVPKSSYVTGYSSEFGKEITFKRVFAGHLFTDAEIEKLLRGEKITIDCYSKNGNPFETIGKIMYFENALVYDHTRSFYCFCTDEMADDPDWFYR